MIAMALVNNPDILIADEPTTALDVTVQAQILELIDRVKTEFDIGVILITHDLGVVADVAQAVMVMYAGRGMELGGKEEGLRTASPPLHVGPPRVHSACGSEGGELMPIQGSPPSLIFVPPGCPFHPRCPHRFAPCDQERPEFRDRGGGHPTACHLSGTRALASGPSERPAAGRGRMSEAAPMPAAPGSRVRGTPLLEAEHLTKRFPINRGLFSAPSATCTPWRT